ncbi:nitrilase-related carbon-nitrogen hydrolase [Plasticicumulans sp.]|uniref:nitrilase-related carbon-nitrogen hydrolase n=1 Tax=Plasticicumulans sp. TaxID=2307179 RepID=UPI000FB6EC66|nr:nitrilase-related carbon-nitrogen hydrolase [Plasticicumulans sp.]MBS0601343.1 carbon-nitrogen family hydrolase [Pseudomonadota bacterium]RTK99987.1 MAG: carbon-nitrogen family hydrolase [Xanthomonadales bacterium]HMV38945.1 nitrilase-related carbon-nitrogen hydrolase [Plasticicumulans sp.]HMW28994.1 nitrilase-related carbon-nitrogen hydrolase [Plasticicumulans sp.]HMW41025.1 nitrilase-related carbon-nitrogen hydrolase [Plasticicumulans sp.]
MQLIAVQTDIRWEDKPANHEHVRELLAAAAPPPGALAVLPEMCMTGFSMKVAKIDEGEARPGEQFLSALAQEFGIFICAGLVTRADDGRGLNQSVTWAPDGSELARYSKCHPFSFAHEDRHYAKGDGPVLYEWAGLRVAPTICYDLRFPELYRIAAGRGAQLYTVIANWPQRREAHWRALLVARAIENQAWVIGVNRCGDDPWLHYGGASLIIDPRGEIIADAGSGPGTIRAEVHLDALLDYRASFPALADMRGEFVPV